jgi:pyridoxamine 5'-phosphate oxidase
MLRRPSGATKPLLKMNDAAVKDEALKDRVWQELARAVRERGHGWRTPVLATVGADLTPQARTVVLRGADMERGELRVFTDGRSPKVAELRARPQAVLVFWHPVLSWQLRAEVEVAVLERGPEVDVAWARVRDSAAVRDYLAPVTPGRLMLAGGGVDGEAPGAGHHHLAVLVARVRAMDWLELRGGGEHRRCRITLEGVQRLVP